MPGGSLPDIQSIDHALELLKNLSLPGSTAAPAASPSPWFVGVGLHKPHIPLKFPKQYLDLYPLASIRPPAVVGVPAGLPPVAYDTFTDVRSRMDTTAVVNRANVTFPYGLFPMDFTLRIRQHYFAAVSYIDAEAGRLLDYVNRTASIMDKTIVVLFGDHVRDSDGFGASFFLQRALSPEMGGWGLPGVFESDVCGRVPRTDRGCVPCPRFPTPQCRAVGYTLGVAIPFTSRAWQLITRDSSIHDSSFQGWQLGDRGEWAKYSTCDTATRTPLIVRTAVGSSTALARRSARTATQGGIRFSSALVEMVDLFATLADLAGLAVPPICPELPSSVNVSVGTAASTLFFDHFSRISQLRPHPIHRGMCSTWWTWTSDADLGLQSDVVSKLGLQASQDSALKGPASRPH